MIDTQAHSTKNVSFEEFLESHQRLIKKYGDFVGFENSSTEQFKPL